MKKILTVLLLIILSLVAKAYDNKTYSLYFSQKGEYEKFVEKYQSGKYTHLEIHFHKEGCNIPNLPNYDYRGIEIWNLMHYDKAIDLSPLSPFHLEEIELTMGTFINLNQLPVDELRILDAGSSQIDAKYINARKYPVLESIEIYTLTGKALDLRNAPKLRELRLYQTSDLEILLLPKNIQLKELWLDKKLIDLLKDINTTQMEILIVNPDYYNNKRDDPNCTFDQIINLQLLNLKKLKISSFSGRNLKLPFMPKLETLEMRGLDIISLDTIKEKCPNIKNLVLCDMPYLTDFSVIKSLPLKILRVHNVPACKWKIPVELPPDCQVIGLPPFYENYHIMWGAFITFALILGTWTFLYQKNYGSPKK